MPFARPALSALLRPALLLVLAVTVGLSGCSKIKNRFKDDKENEGVPVATLYAKGQKLIRKHNYSGAVSTYKRLVAQYPYGPYTEQALVETAYAQYKSGNNEDAVSTIDRFLRTYPTHKDSAYLYYLRGLVNADRDTVFLQRVWKLNASNRDLSTPQQAYNDFKLVTERYPNSRYAADARQQMVILRDLFARHEMDSALYYMRRDANIAAVERVQYMLETYPQSKYENDGIALMGEAYRRLGNAALSDGARQQLQQRDPRHPWLTAEAGKWPDYPSLIRKLNPFATEKTPVDVDEKHRRKAERD